jgi:hypothetical protein
MYGSYGYYRTLVQFAGIENQADSINAQCRRSSRLLNVTEGSSDTVKCYRR